MNLFNYVNKFVKIHKADSFFQITTKKENVDNKNFEILFFDSVNLNNYKRI